MKNINRVIISFFGCMLLFSLMTSTFATESKEYQSNGQISFYGKYVYPDEEEDKEDNDIIFEDEDQNDGTQSGNDSNVEKPDKEAGENNNGSEKAIVGGKEVGNTNIPTQAGNQSSGMNKVGTSKESLPQTGLNHSLSIGIIGLMMTLMGLVVLLTKKNKRKGFE